MKFMRSACIEPMYYEIPFLDRFQAAKDDGFEYVEFWSCLLYTSPSPRDRSLSRMPSSA